MERHGHMDEDQLARHGSDHSFHDGQGAGENPEILEASRTAAYRAPAAETQPEDVSGLVKSFTMACQHDEADGRQWVLRIGMNFARPDGPGPACPGAHAEIQVQAAQPSQGPRRNDPRKKKRSDASRSRCFVTDKMPAVRATPAKAWGLLTDRLRVDNLQAPNYGKRDYLTMFWRPAMAASSDQIRTGLS